MKWGISWPWLVRFGSLAMLAGLGLILWHVVPPQPRWCIGLLLLTLPYWRRRRRGRVVG